MAPEQTTRESKHTIRELTSTELNVVSGGSVAKPFPEPIPGPSPTFPPVVN